MKSRARRGVALAIALFALVTVAALAYAIIAPALAARRSATRSAMHAAAESLAERGVGEVLGAAEAKAWREMVVGGTRVMPVGRIEDLPRGPTATMAITATVRRLTESQFLIEAIATVAGVAPPVAARRTLVVELRADSAEVAAALTSGGTVRLGATTEIRRSGTCLDGWPDDSTAVLRIAPWTDLRWPGHLADPRVARDSAAGGSGTYRRPAGIDLSRYREVADVMLSDGTVVHPEPRARDGRCLDDHDGWGEPWRDREGAIAACGERWPIVHARGDLRSTGGRGQGVLIVDGHLEIGGAFHYEGIIVAAGGITATGEPITLVGAVYTGATAPASFDIGRATIVASRCAVQSALDANPRIVPISRWAWGW